MATVNIHGKEYSPVEDRLKRFYTEHPEGNIITELLSDPNMSQMSVFKATVTLGGIVLATGHAMELQGDGNINKHCHLENAETSAIGRALANWKYAGTGERPSAEEMVKATRPRQQPTPATPPPAAQKAPESNPVAPDSVIDAEPWMLEDIGFGKHSGTPWINVEQSYIEWLAKGVDKKSGEPGPNNIKAKQVLAVLAGAKPQEQSVDDWADEVNAELDSVPF